MINNSFEGIPRLCTDEPPDGAKRNLERASQCPALHMGTSKLLKISILNLLVYSLAVLYKMGILMLMRSMPPMDLHDRPFFLAVTLQQQFASSLRAAGRMKLLSLASRF